MWRWVGGLDHELLLQKTEVPLRSQTPESLAPWCMLPSFGLCRYLHACAIHTDRDTDIYRIPNQINLFKK